MIKIKATTVSVLSNKVVSTAPNAPKRSAKIPPAPVTLIFKPSISLASSRMVSTIPIKAGSPLGKGVTILSLEISIFIKSASPSSDAIGNAFDPVTR